MFGLGLRNSEACGASYSDIVQICPSENLKALRVWETTEGNTNDLRTGGKTRNMPRLVPIPTRIADFLDKRLQALGTDAGGKEDQIPIACKGSWHDVRLTRDQLSAAARQLFCEIKMKEGEVISLELDESIERAWGEKEPTAYLFRRNFATHLFVLGLEIEEIEYLMGHKISGRYEVRSDFANPDLLLQIAKKMQYRPLINEVSDTVSICLDSVGECCGELPIGGRLEVTLPKGTSQISIISGEPGDKLDIHIHETKKLKMDARIHGEAFRPERVLNNLVSYRRRYEG